MKKQAFLIGLLIIMLVLPSQVHAQEDYYWHTSDRYGVELDGEGDAFVVAILTFEGLKENINVGTITLEIPGTKINVLKAIQTPYTYSYYGSYYPESQQQSSFITYDLNRLSDSTLITLNLKTPIMPNQQTTVVLIYQTQDVAKPTLNGLEFNFQTIKDSSAIIRDVGADIYVPSNMELKGKPKFDIQYTPSSFGTFATASQSAISTSEMSRYISPYYSRTAQFSAQNLDPNESFTVKGLYGDNAFLLYLNEIIVSIIVLLAIILIFKHFKLIPKIKEMFKYKNVNMQKTKTSSAEFSWTRVLVTGIGSGFIYLITSLITQFLFGLLQRFNISGSSSLFFPLFLILYIIVFFLPVVAFFAPSIYLSKMYSWKEGLFAFIIGVFTSVFLLYILSTVIPITSGSILL